MAYFAYKRYCNDNAGGLTWFDVKKEALKLFRKLKKERGLSDTERALFAISLTATPDERWEMNMRQVRSLGLSARLIWKTFGSKL